MKNQVQLITYVDRLAGGGFAELKQLLDGPLQGAFGAVHVLPFYHPIDGADAGFDPIDHLSVDTRLGSWDDILALTRSVDVMADVIVNHISSHSTHFLDYSQRAERSPWNGLFLTLDRVFPDRARERDLEAVYRHSRSSGRRIPPWMASKTIRPPTHWTQARSTTWSPPTGYQVRVPSLSSASSLARRCNWRLAGTQ